MDKRRYGVWGEQDMKNAIEEYKRGNIGLNQCCEKYGIPKKTFLRHIRGEVKRGIVSRGSRSLNGRLSALPPEVENELASHILKMEELMFGMTIRDVCKLAYDIIENNPYLKNPFNKEKKSAGKKWYYSFMKRHPNLSLRQPECVSMARCKGFNKTNVNNFFDLLENIVDENKIVALTIYNVDESGFSTVQKKCSKIVGKKGKHQIGALSSGERGVNTTLVVCTSASGNYIPPMIIFKRKRMHPSLANGAPPGSLVEVSETGYINSELFVKWLKHFISYVKPSKNSKVLLVLDGHTTHSKNLEAINLARENGVLILQLPGHTTHRLQPLDVAIFKPLETYYDTAIMKWMRGNPGRQVTQLEVAGLISEAYQKAATLSNAASGFRATGIWPVNRSVFSDKDFVASENINPLGSLVECGQNKENESLNGNDTDDRNMTEVNLNNNDIPNIITGFKSNLNESNVPEDCTNRKLNAGTVNTSLSSNCSELLVPINAISPVPKGSTKYQKRNNKGAQKATIITSSPYKNELEGLKQKQVNKELKKRAKTAVKAVFSNNQGVEKGKSEKRKAVSNKTGGKKRKLGLSEDVDIVINKEEWYCFLCDEQSIEDMVCCLKCNQWAHETCTGCDDEASREKFICDFCLS